MPVTVVLWVIMKKKTSIALVISTIEQLDLRLISIRTTLNVLCRLESCILLAYIATVGPFVNTLQE